MKRTAAMMTPTSTARDTYPEEAINDTKASNSDALMPIDLLDPTDLERFTTIRALDFDDENFADNFDYYDPHPTEDFIAFVTSKKVPDDNEELYNLCEYVIDQFPALALNLFQTAEITELGHENFSDRAVLGLINLLKDYTGLKTFSAYNFSISMQTLSKFLNQNNSVVKLDLQNIEIDGDNYDELTTALAENSTITNLELEISDLSDNQIDCLTRGIARNTSLKKINFSANFHVQKNSKKFSESLVAIISQNSCLEKIKIPFNIDESEMLKVVESMGKNETITYFKLDLNYVSNNVLAVLQKIMSKNKSIEQLCSPKSWEDHFNASIGDVIRIELLSSIKIKMDRNVKFALPATKNAVDGASIGLFGQFQIPPEIGLLISSFITPREGIGMIAVDKATHANARSYSPPRRLS